jgi:hypothetical protein
LISLEGALEQLVSARMPPNVVTCRKASASVAKRLKIRASAMPVG